MRNFLGTSNDTDLINSADLRAETTVNAEDFTINNSGKDKEIKNLAARLPDRCISILLLALFIETIDLGDLAGLMVATDQRDLIRVSIKVSDKEDDSMR